MSAFLTGRNPTDCTPLFRVRCFSAAAHGTRGYDAGRLFGLAPDRHIAKTQPAGRIKNHQPQWVPAIGSVSTTAKRSAFSILPDLNFPVVVNQARQIQFLLLKN